MYSLSTGPRVALPSPDLEKGVFPDPLRWISFKLPFLSLTSPKRIALPSPS